ncbi:MAG: YbaB/EbfC family nucleoid-associated protein [Planctomycetota bacterium]|jgi:DNA-binding YbaB/EbfC family protein|nr:YbaB/EbfC family nucleoid-associated protein [Planctomycetota bacterium]
MGGMGNLFDMMKNAKQMLEKAKSAQGELAKKTAEGTSGAGMVAATVNGMGELIGLTFDPAAITPDDPDMLADLVIAAVADARKKIIQARGEAMKDLTGGVDLSSLGIDPAGIL